MRSILEMFRTVLKLLAIGLTCLLVVGVVIELTNPEEETKVNTEVTPITTDNQNEEVKVEVEDKTTTSQKNAIKKAELYLTFAGLSRQGLIQQLEFEQFSTEDATYAVDNIKVDWNEQAVKKAKSYSDLLAFSRDGLIDQLKFEGFTQEQAEAGANGVGYK